MSEVSRGGDSHVGRFTSPVFGPVLAAKGKTKLPELVVFVLHHCITVISCKREGSGAQTRDLLIRMDLKGQLATAFANTFAPNAVSAVRPL